MFLNSSYSLGCALNGFLHSHLTCSPYHALTHVLLYLTQSDVMRMKFCKFTVALPHNCMHRYAMIRAGKKKPLTPQQMYNFCNEPTLRPRRNAILIQNVWSAIGQNKRWSLVRAAHWAVSWSLAKSSHVMPCHFFVRDMVVRRANVRMQWPCSVHAVVPCCLPFSPIFVRDMVVRRANVCMQWPCSVHALFPLCLPHLQPRINSITKKFGEAGA